MRKIRPISAKIFLESQYWINLQIRRYYPIFSRKMRRRKNQQNHLNLN